MVKYDVRTSGVFGALSDKTRFDIVTRLSREGSLPAGAIASPYRMSLPAVSKHLRVLEDARLVVAEKRGRTRIYSVNRESLDNFRRFIEDSGLFWNDALERMKKHVESKHRRSKITR